MDLAQAQQILSRCNADYREQVSINVRMFSTVPSLREATINEVIRSGRTEEEAIALIEAVTMMVELDNKGVHIVGS